MFENEYIAFTGDTGDFDLLQNDYKLAELAQLFPNVNSILIPKKAEYNLKNYVSKALLKEIDPDTNIAVEKCLLVLSNFASTYYTENKWKPLSSAVLHEQTKSNDNTFVYTKILDVLKTGTKTGAFIEVMTNGDGEETYIVGEKSKQYRLTETYLKAKLKEYLIQDEEIIRRRNKSYLKQLKEANKNPICANLFDVYPDIDLPTSKELLAIGKQLVKKGYTTKKGKRLTMRNKHDNSYWKDYQNRSFVEDNIELFEFLTKRGYMIPTIGDERSGGRIVDSFTLMPAWIRNEITISGKKLSECDYCTLHPNIAMTLYGGRQKFLTHEYVAEMSHMDVKDVKLAHLSFFNMKLEHMKNTRLYNHYNTLGAEMLYGMYHDKKEHGYKITSKRMFAVEVAIMTDVIKHLNSIGIFVLYVYDALLCEEKDKPVVIETMNRIILEHGVKTTVKVKDETSAEIEVVSAIEDRVTKADNEETITDIIYLKRLTIEEYFKRFRIKYGSHITESSLDIHYKVLSKHYTFVDEIPDEHKSGCVVETNIDGVFGKINIFK
ncbi:hypothetical protein FSS13T_02970 [Flavobacterium saliperosum S13]|uniref:Uncharacterized protein n=2 Tax=Flavobacterium saliperosum TaxID=329186 RepID=A0A1G4V534_9FLAO|nr:hypothetical protein [Flavobacterium saliperosum]ESU27819.1 hypothetical protein FSS13T_02970 [Flavobacterium saliperosum S13]SCX01337.1 hypothetical protein SAMN02927925_00312 [Flavobacterium saliperosum]